MQSWILDLVTGKPTAESTSTPTGLNKSAASGFSKEDLKDLIFFEEVDVRGKPKIDTRTPAEIIEDERKSDLSFMSNENLACMLTEMELIATNKPVMENFTEHYPEVFKRVEKNRKACETKALKLMPEHSLIKKIEEGRKILSDMKSGILKQADIPSPWVVEERDGKKILCRRDDDEIVKESEKLKGQQQKKVASQTIPYKNGDILISPKGKSVVAVQNVGANVTIVAFDGKFVSRVTLSAAAMAKKMEDEKLHPIIRVGEKRATRKDYQGSPFDPQGETVVHFRNPINGVEEGGRLIYRQGPTGQRVPEVYSPSLKRHINIQEKDIIGAMKCIVEVIGEIKDVGEHLLYKKGSTVLDLLTGYKALVLKQPTKDRLLLAFENGGITEVAAEDVEACGEEENMDLAKWIKKQEEGHIDNRTFHEKQVASGTSNFDSARGGAFIESKAGEKIEVGDEVEMERALGGKISGVVKEVGDGIPESHYNRFLVKWNDGTETRVRPNDLVKKILKNAEVQEWIKKQGSEAPQFFPSMTYLEEYLKNREGKVIGENGKFIEVEIDGQKYGYVDDGGKLVRKQEKKADDAPTKPTTMPPNGKIWALDATTNQWVLTNASQEKGVKIDGKFVSESYVKGSIIKVGKVEGVVTKIVADQYDPKTATFSKIKSFVMKKGDSNIEYFIDEEGNTKIEEKPMNQTRYDENGNLIEITKKADGQATDDGVAIRIAERMSGNHFAQLFSEALADNKMVKVCTTMVLKIMLKVIGEVPQEDFTSRQEQLMIKIHDELQERQKQPNKHTDRATQEQIEERLRRQKTPSTVEELLRTPMNEEVKKIKSSLSEGFMKKMGGVAMDVDDFLALMEDVEKNPGENIEKTLSDKLVDYDRKQGGPMAKAIDEGIRNEEKEIEASIREARAIAAAVYDNSLPTMDSKTDPVIDVKNDPELGKEIERLLSEREKGNVDTFSDKYVGQTDVETNGVSHFFFLPVSDRPVGV
jgi:hypothetical protein